MKNKGLSLKQKVAITSPSIRKKIGDYLWVVGITKFADDDIDFSKLNQEQILKVEQFLISSQSFDQRS